MKFLEKINKKIIVLLDQGIFSGQSFLINIIMAHLLPIKEFGFFSSIILMCYLLISITNSIVINPIQVNLHKVKNPNSYLSFGLIFQISLSITFLIFAGFIFEIFFPKISIRLVLAALFFSFSFLIYDYFRKIFLAFDKLNECLVLDILQMVSQVSLLAVFSLFKINNLIILLTGVAIAYYPALFYSIIKIRFKNISSTIFRFYFYFHLNQGYWLLFTAILQWMSGNFFTMISGMYLGLEALGAFRLVQSLFGLLNILLQTFENYVLPSAARLQAESIKLSKSYIRKITFEAGMLFFSILFLLFIFSEQTISLFGGIKFIPYSYVVKLMAVLYLLIYISYPIRLGIRLANKNKLFFQGYFFSFLFSLCSFHFFLKYGNLTGAAIGLMMNQILLISYWKYNLITKKI